MKMESSSTGGSSEIEELRLQQGMAMARWRYRLAACDPSERAQLEAEYRQDKEDWEKRTGRSILVSADREKLLKATSLRDAQKKDRTP